MELCSSRRSYPRGSTSLYQTRYTIQGPLTLWKKVSNDDVHLIRTFAAVPVPNSNSV